MCQVRKLITLVSIKSSELEDRDFTTNLMMLRMYAEQDQRYKKSSQQSSNKSNNLKLKQHILFLKSAKIQ